MTSEDEIPPRAPTLRSPETQLKIIIVGAGLGGLGSSISLLLSGHRHHVLILESATSLSEIGAGIQILPNSSRILQRWGLRSALAPFSTAPKCVNFLSWRGSLISSMDMADSAATHGGKGTFYWDFHRANLHAVLLARARSLGAEIRTGSRVVDVLTRDDGAEVIVHTSSSNDTSIQEGRIPCDLVIGADGISSRMREILLSKNDNEKGGEERKDYKRDPPTPTGDLAYRLLLDTRDMLTDPDLAPFVTDPQVNYWLGPQKHVVNYVLRGGELFNMVLLVPDDIAPSLDDEGEDEADEEEPGEGTEDKADEETEEEPCRDINKGRSRLQGRRRERKHPLTASGPVSEMRHLFAGWDARLVKLLDLCREESILKWKLCIRAPLQRWSDARARLVLLGDAVHATLPYLASGAGMCLEDADVLGLCLGRVRGAGQEEVRRALEVYERCRKARTEMVVERGLRQQWLYHLDDGPEQEERDRAMRERPTGKGEALAWRDPGLAPRLLGYDCERAVEEEWARLVEREAGVDSKL